MFQKPFDSIHHELAFFTQFLSLHILLFNFLILHTNIYILELLINFIIKIWRLRSS